MAATPTPVADYAGSLLRRYLSTDGILRVRTRAKDGEEGGIRNMLPAVENKEPRGFFASSREAAGCRRRQAAAGGSALDVLHIPNA
jgi:hypothetical protein